MKKIYILCLLLITNCVSQQKITQQEIKIPIELDRPRMEKIIQIMPVIIQKSEIFKKNFSSLKISDQEYNTRFYNYLYEDTNFADLLTRSGFKDSKFYEEFYNTMLEMYILLLEQPETLDTAVLSIAAHDKEINALLLKQAKEPNNKNLEQTLKKMQYEVTVYRNLVLVNTFKGQLNSFNNTDK